MIPSTILRVTGGKQYVDAGAHLKYRDLVWLGAFIRSSEQFNVQASLVINELVKKINNQLMIGYSFDSGYSSLYSYSGVSHEIILKYDLKKRPNPDHILKQRKSISPLFF